MPGGPHEKNPLWHLAPQSLEAIRVPQELDDFAQLLLCAVGPGHVVERGVLLVFVVELGLALADRKEPLALRLHAAEEDVPHPKQQQNRQEAHDHQAPRKVALRLGHHVHILSLQQVHQLFVTKRGQVGNKVLVRGRISLRGPTRLGLQLAIDRVALYLHALHIFLLELFAKLAIANAFAPRGPHAPIAVGPQGEQRPRNDPDDETPSAGAGRGPVGQSGSVLVVVLKVLISHVNSTGW